MQKYIGWNHWLCVEHKWPWDVVNGVDGIVEMQSDYNSLDDYNCSRQGILATVLLTLFASCDGE